MPRCHCSTLRASHRTRSGQRYGSWRSVSSWFLRRMRCLRPPFWSCWWRCLRCWRLSRCVCSLASAGNLCCAKPNHAFFHCQQARKIFFQSPARNDHHRRTWMSCAYRSARARQDVSGSCVIATRQQWRGSQRSLHACDVSRMHSGDYACARRLHAHHVQPSWNTQRDTPMCLRVAQVALRENCAKFFRSSKR